MDIDALSTSTQGVFISKISKLFNSFFETERNVIIVDDLRNLRQSNRDFNQLKTFIECAAQPKVFKGSRIILISSFASAPLWMKIAGVARIPVDKLEDKYLWRVLEYQLRNSGLVTGEIVPEIPQKLIDTIKGHPLAAKIAVEASRKIGLLALSKQSALNTLAIDITSVLLPMLSLSPEEEQLAQIVSIFRLPIRFDHIFLITRVEDINKLVEKGLIDFDGNSYSMHPILRTFISQKFQQIQQITAHKIAAGYYSKLHLENEAKRILDINLVAELAHHLSLAHEFADLDKYKNLVFDELYPAARELYLEHSYDKALELFLLLVECRPNDPYIWAYIGRCHGRRGQWTDCDHAFNQSLQAAKVTKQPNWWIYRDWGHIQARFNRWSEAQNHYKEAKKVGGSSDPSVTAAEAYVEWKTGNKPDAKIKFESVLKYHPEHRYTLSTYSSLLEQDGETTYADELRSRLFNIEQQMLIPQQYDIDSDSDDQND